MRKLFSLWRSQREPITPSPDLEAATLLVTGRERFEIPLSYKELSRAWSSSLKARRFRLLSLQCSDGVIRHFNPRQIVFIAETSFFSLTP